MRRSSDRLAFADGLRRLIEDGQPAAVRFVQVGGSDGSFGRPIVHHTHIEKDHLIEVTSHCLLVL
ncbi:MAG: hypothetical protein WD229_11050, partial [Pirellulales bacterium]